MSIHRTPIQLRFSDVDMLQHVNNAKFPTYMELGRINYFNEVISSGHNWRETGIIVAAYSVQFVAPIFFTDVLFIETEVESMGTKSFNITYRFVVETETGPIVKATANTVMVCFHYIENKSIPIPQVWKDKVNAFQQTSF